MGDKEARGLGKHPLSAAGAAKPDDTIWICEGEKDADLKTANALGLAIPNTMQLLADEVIE
jgi:hypothetical protein